MKQLLPLILLLCLGTAMAQDRYTVFFDHDKDELNPEWMGNLQKWARANLHSKILRVEGYTDSTGSAGYNNKLAARRIDHVRNFLVTTQAALPELKVFGETMSQQGNDADNRKVVIIYEPEIKTPALPPPAPAPKPKEGRVEPLLEKEVAAAEVGDVLELRGLNFYGDSGKPLPESEPRLAELLKIMKARPTLTIQIQGHICCMEDDYMGVARMRAQTVYHYLIDNGIAKDRVSYKSFEGKRPLYPMPEENEEQRVANRRVEIQIVAF